ncbi:hypothetical protein AAG747_13135 [Rapidithrix thailandica]|uniref:Uncharacterized protein n=1 Tax=Rapidithrix thailandica TaxID=413964 RepID=A0AAW9S7E2_9BACT
MLYFLVLTIPFTAAMLYLLIHNKKLQKHYDQLAAALVQFAQAHHLSTILEKHDVSREIVVTETAIKRLEKLLNEFEEHFQSKKSKFISNTFTPRKKKMDFIFQKLNKLERKAKEVAV